MINALEACPDIHGWDGAKNIIYISGKIEKLYIEQYLWCYSDDDGSMEGS